MIAAELLAPSVFAFIGGVSAIQAIVLVGLLVSTSLLFMVMQNEYSTKKSFMLSAGMYVLMGGYAFLMLN